MCRVWAPQTGHEGQQVTASGGAIDSTTSLDCCRCVFYVGENTLMSLNFDVQLETWSMSCVFNQTGSCIKSKSTRVASTSLPATGSFARTPASPALEVDLLELEGREWEGHWELRKNGDKGRICKRTLHSFTGCATV